MHGLSSYIRSYVSTMCVVAASSVLLSFGAAARAGVALSDNFDAAVQEDDVIVAGVTTKHIKSAATWYGINQAAGGSSAAIATDTNSPLSGNVLSFSSTSSNSTMLANFSSVTLANAGDWIQLSMNYRYTASPSGTNAAIGGLYNSNASPVSQNHLGERAEITNDTGYQVAKIGASGTSDLLLKKLSGGNNYYYINAGTQVGAAASTNVNPSTAALSSVYTLILKITLASNGTDRLVDTSFTAPGGNTVNGTQQVLSGTDVTTRTFNEVGISFSGSANADTIEITTGAVPEPASMGALFCGVFVLVTRRRF